MLEQLFLESPWPLMLVLLAGAFIFRVMARQRNDNRYMIGTAALFLTAVAIWLIAANVTTDRERIQQVIAEMVHATEGAFDLDALERHMTGDAALERHDGEVWLRLDEDRDQILTLAERHLISEHHIREITVRLPEPERAEVDLRIRSELERQPSARIPTTWELTFEQHDDQWLMTRARWTEIRGQSPDQGIAP